MLKDLVLKNRSYRGFNPNRPITCEELTDMVDCARLTASTVNIQPMKYYLAWQKEQTDKILPCIKFAKALTNIQLPHPGTKPTAYIVILLDKSISDNVARYQRDYGIAAQTILLRAAEMGLGGCMIGSVAVGELKEALNLPEHIAPMLVVALGEPAEDVRIVEISEGESIGYFRDENDVHYVPKRKLEDIIIK